MEALAPRCCLMIAYLSANAGCAEEATQDNTATTGMLALDPTESWAGKTLQDWAAEYLQWYYSPTDCKDYPTNDVDGSRCDSYQDPNSPVFMFDTTPLSEASPEIVQRTKCHVPAGKAILVPVAAFFGDNAGLSEQISDDEFISTLTDVRNSIRELVLSADGMKVGKLKERAIGPLRLSYHVPATPNRFGCDDAKMVSDVDVDPSFLVGVFALFKPPSVGAHELEYASTLTFYNSDYAFHVRTNFDVVQMGAKEP